MWLVLCSLQGPYQGHRIRRGLLERRQRTNVTGPPAPKWGTPLSECLPRQDHPAPAGMIYLGRMPGEETGSVDLLPL